MIHILVLALHTAAFAQPATDFINRKADQWQADLKELASLAETEHLNYKHSITEEAWKAHVHIIDKKIPNMTDLEIIGAFMAILAKIGDGHTLLYPPFQGEFAFKMLPVEFYIFQDGVYIRGAEQDFRPFVGSRVIKVGTMEIEEVLRACIPFISHDNEMQLKWIVPIALTFGDIYKLIGASKNSNAIDIELETIDGTIVQKTLYTGPPTRDPMSRFVPEHWVDMREGNNLLTKDPENYYWYEYLEKTRTVYFQLNQIRDKEEHSLRAFCEELFSFIKSHDVEALIIDIRLNNGGNNSLNQALVNHLVMNEKINKPGKLFTIIGRRTFSAAMNLASDLENNTATLFVGEPTGSRPNFYGEDNPFTLTNSKLNMSISNRYWQGGTNADDNRPWIAPNLPAELSAEQYRNNEDPALDAILDFLVKENK